MQVLCDTWVVKVPVQLLHLEDSEDDHLLVLAQLHRGGFAVQAQRVETAEQFESALATHWDLVLSDYHLPGFTGVQALRMLQQAIAAGRAVVPFIIVSGQIGEDTAVEAMRSGASDYLLKNNLSRLAQAVSKALTAAAIQRAKWAADEALEASRAQLSALTRHLQTSVEAERQAIAREIHDDVGGSLTALHFELDSIRRHNHDPALQPRLVSALAILSHAIGASQRIMQNLRPAILDQGLVAALQWLTRGFEKRTGIVCELRCQPAEGELPDLPTHVLPTQVPLVAYRCVQEALTNVQKHANASRVVVDLSLSAGVLSLEVSDDGRGISPADLAKAQSFGVRGLKERALTVGGWVELSSSHGVGESAEDGSGGSGGPRRNSGTSLILSVPLDAAAMAASEWAEEP